MYFPVEIGTPRAGIPPPEMREMCQIRPKTAIPGIRGNTFISVSAPKSPIWRHLPYFVVTYREVSRRVLRYNGEDTFFKNMG